MDHPLVEWLASLPNSLKVQGQEGKFLLKKSMEPHLPHEIMYRPKMGFSVPLARWFRGPLRRRVEESILGSTLESTGIFDVRMLRHLFQAHVAGTSDYSAPLWTVLMFDAFLRQSGITDSPSLAHHRVA
jgi:asparagine synthase (glutamine-hydrolysing)